jgi:hypothetical protein
MRPVFPIRLQSDLIDIQATLTTSRSIAGLSIHPILWLSWMNVVSRSVVQT